MDQCRQQEPVAQEIRPGQWVACHAYQASEAK